jgi:hypothetical protein
MEIPSRSNYSQHVLAKDIYILTGWILVSIHECFTTYSVGSVGLVFG